MFQVNMTVDNKDQCFTSSTHLGCPVICETSLPVHLERLAIPDLENHVIQLVLLCKCKKEPTEASLTKWSCSWGDVLSKETK